MATEKPTSPGDSFVCRECGKETIAKRETIMDGWTVVGEALVCAFCKAPAVDSDDDMESEESSSSADESHGIDRLADLLNEAPAETKRLAREDDARFCRDCVNFLRHPFVSRCLLHDKPVEPMDDCDDFDPRPDAVDCEESNS